MLGYPGDPAPPAPVVAVVEDDRDAWESLEFLLGSRGFAAAGFASAEALLAAGVPRLAACLVTDVRLGAGMDGVALVEELRRRGEATPVVVVTGHADVPMAVRAMRAGAVDFVEKPFAPERIFNAVAEAAAAGAPGRSDGDAGTRAGAGRLLASLTPRELQVLGGLVAGWTNKAVAHELGISPRTVETYRAAIMAKLRARSFAEAVRIGLAGGVGAGP